jgi:hypothetical protein
MAFPARWLVLVPATVLVGLLAAPSPRAQQNEIDNNFKYNSGQDVQPVFEGWSHSPDGGFAMHFGYLNRNWAQELSIPVGPNNNLDPGGPDRGQPTYFYTRTQRNMFTVNVPKDWGKKELTWTIVANGKTQKAIAWLQPEWEIDPAGGANTGGRTDDVALKNKPPTLTVDATMTATVSAPLSLNAKYSDDGLPKPTTGQRKPAIGQETPPILQGGVSDAPVNVPQVAAPAPGGGGGGRGQGPQGPTVTWIVWRGPAGATFNPRVVPVKDGAVQTSVVFAKPGEYVLRGRATDRMLTTIRDVRVTVK